MFKLIVGLGNPGRDYEATRHNAGFWWVERLASTEGASFAPDSKFFGRVAKLRSGIWLLEPTTYMNRSGLAAGALARFYRIAPEEILVVHDELDLLPGEVKLKQGGGHAGHNGLKDLIAQLGGPNFWRLRIGIGHPRTLNLSQEVVDFVLHPPRAAERTLIDQAMDKAIDLWPLLAAGDITKATQALHTKPKAEPAR